MCSRFWRLGDGCKEGLLESGYLGRIPKNLSPSKLKKPPKMPPIIAAIKKDEIERRNLMLQCRAHSHLVSSFLNSFHLYSLTLFSAYVALGTISKTIPFSFIKINKFKESEMPSPGSGTDISSASRCSLVKTLILNVVSISRFSQSHSM